MPPNDRRATMHLVLVRWRSRQLLFRAGSHVEDEHLIERSGQMRVKDAVSVRRELAGERTAKCRLRWSEFFGRASVERDVQEADLAILEVSADGQMLSVLGPARETGPDGRVTCLEQARPRM